MSGDSGRRTFLARGAALLAGAGLAPFGAGSTYAADRMDAGAPSETALGAARLRAAHQILEYPRVLHDPYALRMLGPGGEAALREHLPQYQSARLRGMRAAMVLRSRHADDRYAGALRRGVRQYVVLGAGLDTFAWRNPYPDGLVRVYEVDHPATQRWKRARLAEMGMALPPAFAFAPVDFERESLADGLARAGFRRDRPAFFSWLGVAIYLSEDAVMQTLRTIASGAPGSEVAFDFTLPAATLSRSAQRRRARAAAEVAKLGEPWITFFTPGALTARVREAGFSSVSVLGPDEANARYFNARSDGFRVSGSHQMAAVV